MKRVLRALPLYPATKWMIRRAVAQFGISVSRSSNDTVYRTFTLRPSGQPCGRVLMSNAIEPYLSDDPEGVAASHQGDVMALEIAMAWLDLGYTVDLIDHRNDLFVPSCPYDVFIDVGSNMERLSPLLGSGCLKIMQIIFAHPLFHNVANYQRHLALQVRRGIALEPARIQKLRFALEVADCGVHSGNDVLAATYAMAKKPLYQVPIPSAVTFARPDDKDVDACRRRFLWLGGTGFVLKGLDLVLEAFAGMPEMELIVCGHLDREESFLQAYHRELFDTPNIRAIGWVDVRGDTFADIVGCSIGAVLVSASEAGAGSVVTAMHGGLLPIVSRECAIDVSSDFGVLVSNINVQQIQRAVRLVANLPPEQLRSMMLRAWEVANARYTRESFGKSYREVAKRILRERTPVEDQVGAVGRTAKTSCEAHR